MKAAPMRIWVKSVPQSTQPQFISEYVLLCVWTSETYHSNLNDHAIALENLVQHSFCAVLWDIANEQLDGVCGTASWRLWPVRPGHIL